MPESLGDIETRTFNCEKHGPQETKWVKLPGGWHGKDECDICKEAARTEENRRWDEYRAKQEQENREFRIQSGIERAAIPLRFRSQLFDNYSANVAGSKRALATCLEYATAFPDRMKTGTSLILCGNAGTGKTHLACAIAQHIIRAHEKSALYTTVGRAFRAVKDTYRRGSSESEGDAIYRFRSPDLLLLDEVGVQFGSETEKNILFEIVNERYEALKPTIMISNLALSALTEYAGERVIDRMKENGGKLVVFDWKSHRGSSDNQRERPVL